MSRYRVPTFIVKLRYRNTRGAVIEINNWRVSAPDALSAIGKVMAEEDCPPQEQLWSIEATHFMEDNV